LKRKSTGLNSSKTKGSHKPSKGNSKQVIKKPLGVKESNKPGAKQQVKLVTKEPVASVKTKTGVPLSAVKGAKQATVVLKSASVAKVSIAEKLSTSHLVKRAEVVELKSKKTALTLVAKSGAKVPATKISRSEPQGPGAKVVTGRFSVEAKVAAPMVASSIKGDAGANDDSESAEMNFKIGDKIVYPGHGVGEIEGLRTTVLGGQEHHIYNIKILDSGMKVMVPVSQAAAVGLRKIIDRRAIDEVFMILKDRNFKIDTQTWNRRFREYSQKIKTGSVFEIAVVLRDLSVLSADKELSFGEKKMLDMAESLLVSEIAIAKSRPHDKVVGELRALFA